jgi:acyl-CoA thioesterase YciA
MNIDKNNPVLRLTPRPNEANPRGDIFGGWIMAQIDLAGMLIGAREVSSQFATVAVKEMTFHHPIFPFDEVSIYGEIIERGKTSFTIELVAYLTREGNYDAEPLLVSKAKMVYALIKKPGEKNVEETLS